jgi:hypothetical protein
MISTVKLPDFETTATRLVDASKVPGVAAMVTDKSGVLYSWVTGFADASLATGRSAVAIASPRLSLGASAGATGRSKTSVSTTSLRMWPT